MIIKEYSIYQDIIERMRHETKQKILNATFKCMSPRQFGPYFYIKSMLHLNRVYSNQYHTSYFRFTPDGKEMILGLVLLEIDPKC